MNTVLEYRPILKQRLFGRFFRSRPLPAIPQGHITGLPWWAKDALYTDVTCHLSFWDKIRVLITGKFVVKIRTCTAEVPGRVETQSVAYPVL